MKKTSSLADAMSERTLALDQKRKENISPIVNDIVKDSIAVKAPKYEAKNKEVDLIADELVSTFGSPGSRAFYCKVAYKLSREVVLRLAQIAKADGNRSPGGLFNVLARREMGEI